MAAAIVPLSRGPRRRVDLAGVTGAAAAARDLLSAMVPGGGWQRRVRPVVLLAALAAGALAGCGRDPDLRQPANRPSVLLVSIDTLRPDHLGCYGYPHPTSPAIDRFRQESILFRQAVAHAPSTLPSHASILTSLLPHRHGASWAHKRALRPGVTTLAELLSREGYATASFNGGGQIAAEFGLARGFALYQSADDEVPFRDTVATALSWLAERRGEPFFLFLHTYEVHHPYQPESRWLELFDRDYEGSLPDAISVALLRKINNRKLVIDDADLRHIVSTYDAEIRSVDAALGDLLDGLRRLGREADTVVVLTSDHGEEFGEHRRVGWHSHSLYDELMLVPLLLRLPGSRHAGALVQSQVRSIDIAPTLLGLLGLTVPSAFEGQDLLGLLGRDEGAPREAVMERDATGRRRAGLRSGRFKLCDDRLYDLAEDPGEKHDVAGLHPEIAARLAARLLALSAAGPEPEAPAVSLDDATRERLRSLGYVE